MSVDQPSDTQDAHHAETSRGLLAKVFGNYPRRDWAIRLWDKSSWRPEGGSEVPRFTIILNHAGSLRRMLSKPNSLDLGESFLADVFDVEGDLLGACELGDYLLRLDLSVLQKLGILAQLRSLPKLESKVSGHPPARLKGAIGSRERLKAAIAYPYDMPTGFWKAWLDPTLAYSCAYFEQPTDSLATAQKNKLDYVCRKLQLQSGEHLLDLGCGWGGLITHAARNYGVYATGITLSRGQADYVRQLIKDSGLEDRVEVQHLDFRDFPTDRKYDKLSCVGAVEHVPAAALKAFFAHARDLMKPGGLFFNHGITRSITTPLPSGPSLVQRYVFPDHGVTTVSEQLVAAEAVGFEVRDVECLREHYAQTCRQWLRSLEENREEVVAHSSQTSQRLYRLYVAAQTYYFIRGANSLHQMLLSRPEGQIGASPQTRAAWYRSPAVLANPPHPATERGSAQQSGAEQHFPRQGR